MRTFHCSCGARVFFENTQCLSCGCALGFVPEAGELGPLTGDGAAELVTPHGSFRKCKQYVEAGVCNWMVPAGDTEELCQACRLNNVIPDLSKPENRALWLEVETAKRRLVYSLNALGLPVVPKREDPDAGLSFDIKADEGEERVLTGHSDGLITLNLGEADAAQRERMRLAMRERYRTLLGHFRHESGHYYWDRLVRDTRWLPSFRELFGDETDDYAAALQRHYGSEAPAVDTEAYISHYAASHPWEDFAETFAHYLHLIDTVETAQQFGFVSERVVGASGGTPPASAGASGVGADFDVLLREWLDLSVALNSLNRSMGLPDAYPFAISAQVQRKLKFVHELVHAPAPSLQRSAPQLPSGEAKPSEPGAPNPSSEPAQPSALA